MKYHLKCFCREGCRHVMIPFHYVFKLSFPIKFSENSFIVHSSLRVLAKKQQQICILFSLMKCLYDSLEKWCWWYNGVCFAKFLHFIPIRVNQRKLFLLCKECQKYFKRMNVWCCRLLHFLIHFLYCIQLLMI